MKKLGWPGCAGEPLYRIHAQYQVDLRFALALAEQGSAYRIGSNVNCRMISPAARCTHFESPARNDLKHNAVGL